MPHHALGDKGLSIFTFAAYHRLTSGENVAEVTLRDSAAHSADPQGVREVQSLGLATIEGDKAILTDEGRQFLDLLVQQIRGAAKHAQRNSAIA